MAAPLRKDAPRPGALVRVDVHVQTFKTIAATHASAAHREPTPARLNNGLPRYDTLPEPMPEEQRLRAAPVESDWEVVIVGGGFAGLSAAIYLARAMRRTLVLDAGESLGQWEPEVQNFFGFPDGISGSELLRRGRRQAERYGARILKDEVDRVEKDANGGFQIYGRHVRFHADRLLIATGLYHLPPKIPGANECIGNSLFFCKDCDGLKVKDKTVVIIGRNNEAVEYALGIQCYSSSVTIATNGEPPAWDSEHARWIEEYEIPILREKIAAIDHRRGKLSAIQFAEGGKTKIDFIFTTRGDIYYSEIARQLGAAIDEDGQIIVDCGQRTNIPGLFAAGCVTQANCQMIIAAGHGAAAAQAINRSLFEESLQNHCLKDASQ